MWFRMYYKMCLVILFWNKRVLRIHKMITYIAKKAMSCSSSLFIFNEFVYQLISKKYVGFKISSQLLMITGICRSMNHVFRLFLTLYWTKFFVSNNITNLEEKMTVRVVHMAPMYPGSQPLMQVPSTWEQLVWGRQCPHVPLHSSPKVPRLQAKK